VKKFSVEELHDEPLAFPPNGRFAGPCTGTSAKKRHEEVIRHLALVSPIPEAVYKKVWPWRLAALIREGIERISTFDGLTQTLQQLDDPRDKLNPLLDPGSFSFWMASNLPLKQEERLDLLEMISPVERLQFIHRKVLEEERAQTEIRCKECGSPLAHATDMFTVGGAEGTTGNYVNEYGSVHQTITLREIDEREVTYVGRPESRDSWFPGYSWTIMQCGFCNSHLGWKFDRLGKRRTGEISRDRPGKFYGVSAGNVSTATSSRGNRRDMTLED
jgi:cereblon